MVAIVLDLEGLCLPDWGRRENRDWLEFLEMAMEDRDRERAAEDLPEPDG